MSSLTPVSEIEPTAPDATRMPVGGTHCLGAKMASPATPPAGWSRSSLRFHLSMGSAALALLAIFFIGCRLTDLVISGLTPQVLGLLIVCAMIAPLPAYWHQKGRGDLRDAALAIPWGMLLSVLLPLPFLVAARLNFPLQDGLLATVDHALHYSTPWFMDWANHHWLGRLVNSSYVLLQPLMMASVLVPGLAGKRQAKEFLMANLIALAAVGACFTLMPVVGPWFPHHFVPGAAQVDCQNQFFALRKPGHYAFSLAQQGTGIVCFPSCHVIWAVLCAAAFWGFRWLRLPVAVLSAMILMSTLTTGWHYLADGLAGLALAAGSIWLARRLLA